MTAPNWILTTENNGAIPRQWRPLVVQDNASGEIIARLPDGHGPRDVAHGNLLKSAPQLLAALVDCITDEGARSMTDESRNAASIARRRLDEINRIAREAIAQATATETPNV